MEIIYSNSIRKTDHYLSGWEELKRSIPWKVSRGEEKEVVR